MAGITHTPGPWQVYGRSSVVTTADKSIIAEVVVHGGQSETKSNARLIAAAPHLLEALKEMVLFCDPYIDIDDVDAGVGLAFAKARVAIAKAEAAL